MQGISLSGYTCMSVHFIGSVNRQSGYKHSQQLVLEGKLWGDALPLESDFGKTLKVPLKHLKCTASAILTDFVNTAI